MHAYPQKVKDNLLPLSVGTSLPEAFREWAFTEHTIDREKPTEVCQLCGQKDLRYQFEIENSLTHKSLWIGSHCILKFDLSVFEEGRRLLPGEAKKKLDRLVQKMRLECCIKVLEKLAVSEKNKILSNALEYYKKNNFLTPKFAYVVLWRLKYHKIDHSPAFFKISLKRYNYKKDLYSMPLHRVHILWPVLSPSQRMFALKIGHTPPVAE